MIIADRYPTVTYNPSSGAARGNNYEMTAAMSAIAGFDGVGAYTIGYVPPDGVSPFLGSGTLSAAASARQVHYDDRDATKTANDLASFTVNYTPQGAGANLIYGNAVSTTYWPNPIGTSTYSGNLYNRLSMDYAAGQSSFRATSVSIQVSMTVTILSTDYQMSPENAEKYGSIQTQTVYNGSVNVLTYLALIAGTTALPLRYAAYGFAADAKLSDFNSGYINVDWVNDNKHYSGYAYINVVTVTGNNTVYDTVTPVGTMVLGTNLSRPTGQLFSVTTSINSNNIAQVSYTGFAGVRRLTERNDLNLGPIPFQVGINCKLDMSAQKYRNFPYRAGNCIVSVSDYHKQPYIDADGNQDPSRTYTSRITFSIRAVMWTTKQVMCYVASRVPYLAVSNTEIYFPRFSGNAVTGEWIRYTPENLDAYAEDWQQGNIDDNDYDGDETPDHSDPDSGGGGGDSGGDSGGDVPEGDATPGEWTGDENPRNTGTGDKIKTPSSFLTLYLLTPSKMSEFGGTLWASLGSDAFLENIWRNISNNFSLSMADTLKYFPICRYYPIDFSHYSTVTEAWNNLYFGRGVSPITISNILRLKSPIPNIGSNVINIDAESDFLDYEPYSTAQLYIPFCGMYQLPVNDIVGAQLLINTHLDVFTGQILCEVYRTRKNRTYYLMSAIGNIGVDIPLTADTDSMRGASMLATTAPYVVAGAIGGLATAGSAIGQIGHQAGLGAPAADAVRGGLASTTNYMPQAMPAASRASGVIGNALGTLGANMGGGLSSISVPNMGGMLAINAPQKPCVYIRRTKTYRAANHGHTSGYPLKSAKTISSLSGYVVANNPDVSGVPATNSERDMIRNLLSTGIYV